MARIKAIQKLSYSTIKLSDNIPAYPTFKYDMGKGFVKFGKKNLFPQELLDITAASPINSSIIKSKSIYTLGMGVDTTKFVGQPNFKQSWNQFLDRLILDYITFGGYSFQIILNEDGKSVSLFHQDFSTVRCGEYDEFGTIHNYYISNDYTKSNIAAIQLPAWNGFKQATKGQPYLFVYNNYVQNMPYYTLPEWYSAINYVDADGQLGKFYNNAINNNFMPSIMLQMPSDPSPEEKDAFEHNLVNTFSGVEKVNKILVMWNQSIDNPIKIEKFEASSNTNLYNTIDEKITQKIITAHRLTSPTLAGLSGSGNLSGNANEIIDSMILFNYSVILNYRINILNGVNQFVRNNYNTELSFIDLPIVDKIKELNQTQTKEEIVEDINENLKKLK
ncbi:MAG: phage portal protein [Prevotella sp.]|jgi:hypothetical protein|nr:phage portal protein [Prevotella sp.]